VRLAGRVLALVLAALLMAPATAARLPVIGPAPAFALTDQAGRPLALADLRGKVFAVTFIYTACTDSCPIITAKMAQIQRRLGADFGPRVRFVSVTVDPLNDTPDVLRSYAGKFGADVPGWSFLTGTPQQIDAVVRGYGAFARRNDNAKVDHLFLTSLIDARGRLRVQYLGYRFDAREVLADLQALLGE
jgi:protein SCO1/2